jgi:hypothetical protein
MSAVLTDALQAYVTERTTEHGTQPEAALFLTRKGTPLLRHTAENIFRRLRVPAGVLRQNGDRYQPVCIICGTPALYTVWFTGIARGLMCNACCRSWQRISDTSTLRPLRAISP